MKTATENKLNGYKLARRMGASPCQRVICPGCGRIERMDGALFALRVEAGQVKEAPEGSRVDGVKWCQVCA